jgi:MSHA biogenesis protein MshP
MRHTFRLRRQAGVGIVTAIFLLVVLAGLGVAMVGIYTSQQGSANIDLLGAQGYQAARAGLEWGLFQRGRNDACPQKSKLVMPAGTSLSAFTVYVTCTAQGSGDLTRWLIKSEACNMPNTVNDSCPFVNNPESIRRTLEAEL